MWDKCSIIRTTAGRYSPLSMYYYKFDTATAIADTSDEQSLLRIKLIKVRTLINCIRN